MIMENNICKIIYFDEYSVTDYIQIAQGGQSETVQETTHSTDIKLEQQGGINGKVGVANILKAIIGLEGSIEAKAHEETEYNKDKVVKSILKNTILTDFLRVVNSSELKRTSRAIGAIKKYKNYKISVEKDSMAYMVMVAPYLSMLGNGTAFEAGEYNIAIDKFEYTLKHAKGYYELLGIRGKNKVVFRFNINSFKNGYTINDLLKMDLCIYAIKVGKTTIDKLNVKEELGMEYNTYSKTNPSYEEEIVKEEKHDDKLLDVYDVLLAGVEYCD